MNCNKCGTPILPGENSCRFCGTVGDYSKRTHEEMKPEIIDFTTGDDDVVIIDDENELIGSPINTTPVIPKIENIPTPIIIPVPEEKELIVPVQIPAPIVMPNNNVIIPSLENTMTIPIVTSIVSEPIVSDINPISFENNKASISDVKEPEVSSIHQNVETLEIVSNAPIGHQESAVSASTPIIVTKPLVKEKVEEKSSEFEDVPEVIKEEKPKKEGHGLFNILTFILIILLLVSVLANCFLLMGNGSDNKEADVTPVVSTTNQTVYFNGYKVEMPSNWIAVTTKDINYVTVMDNTEDWAFTLNIAENTNSSNVSKTTSVDNITKAFGLNKYLFTSDYSKKVGDKDFYIFKGKYYDYSVYVITLGLDSTNTVVADLKFKGEVDDTVLSSVLSSLATVTTKDLTTFYKNDFSFSDITPLITNNVAIEASKTEGN